MQDYNELNSDEEEVLWKALQEPNIDAQRAYICRIYQADQLAREKLIAMLELQGKASTLFQSLEQQTLFNATADGFGNVGSNVRFAKYEIVRLVGSGGMGTVFKAYDTELQCHVALKVLRLELASNVLVRDQFYREAKTVENLSHERLQRILEVGSVGALPYIASEWCEAGDLAKWLKDRTTPLAPKSVAVFMAKICEGLAQCHAQRIVHLDLKPANVLLKSLDSIPEAESRAFIFEEVTLAESRDATVSEQRAVAESRASSVQLDALSPVLSDFGIARVLDAAISGFQSSFFAGTFQYMAPEQLSRRFGRVGPRTDIYAIGLILGELLGCKPPRSGADLQSSFSFLDADASQAEGWLSDDIPSDLKKIIRRSVAVDPAHRYASVSLLMEDLTRFATEQPVQVKSISLAERLSSWLGQTSRIREMALLVGIYNFSQLIWLLSSVYFAFGKSFPQEHFDATVYSAVYIALGHALPMVGLMIALYRGVRWSAVIALAMAIPLQVIIPALILSKHITLMSIYAKYPYFEATNHFLVLTGGLIQFVALSIAIFAMRQEAVRQSLS